MLSPLNPAMTSACIARVYEPIGKPYIISSVFKAYISRQEKQTKTSTASNLRFHLFLMSFRPQTVLSICVPRQTLAIHTVDSLEMTPRCIGACEAPRVVLWRCVRFKDASAHRRAAPHELDKPLFSPPPPKRRSATPYRAEVARTVKRVHCLGRVISRKRPRLRWWWWFGGAYAKRVY